MGLCCLFVERVGFFIASGVFSLMEVFGFWMVPGVFLFMDIAVFLYGCLCLLCMEMIGA